MAKGSTSLLRGISVSEYVARRDRVQKELKGAVAVVFSGEGSPPQLGKWRPDMNFQYLTGIHDEYGAAVVFNPSAEDSKRRIQLFLKPIDSEKDRWDGYRAPINSQLKAATGFESIARIGSLPTILTTAARRTKHLAMLHAPSIYPSPVNADLAAYKQLAERIPGIQIEDRSDLLASMRSVKSAAEIALMKTAIQATAGGYNEMFKMLKPGISEADVDQALLRGYLAHGGSGVAYNSIVGSGLNGTVLHYNANNGPVQDGDLMVIDSAAEYLGYASDVTRTLPVNGKFTVDQRELYEVVLAAQLASIKSLRPGVTSTDFDNAARAVIEKAGYGDAYIHGTGHPLGLAVHDVIPDHPFKAGSIVTIEPGIYFPDLKLGIRIEDDILITAKGSENLTAMIPKSVKDIEAALHI